MMDMVLVMNHVGNLSVMSLRYQLVCFEDVLVVTH